MKPDKLTDNIQVAHLRLHWISVDLTHVPALIRLFHVAYPQLPNLFFRVGDGNSMVFGDNMILNRQNCLCIDAQPRDLCKWKHFRSINGSYDGGKHYDYDANITLRVENE